MNITEANATQKLLRYLLDPHDDTTEANEQARDAAAFLADRSSKPLGTAWVKGEDVQRLWPDLMDVCDGCDQCERPIETVPVGNLL